MTKTKALLKYKVRGFDGEHTAGPYTLEEVGSQRDDIRDSGLTYDINTAIVEVDENDKIIEPNEGPCAGASRVGSTNA